MFLCRVSTMVLMSSGVWAIAAQPPHVGVGLRVSNETAPPGGVVQIKVSLTEPKPIPTGSFGLDFEAYAVSDFLGLAVASTSGDASCAAVRSGPSLDIRCTSPLATLGLVPDYPTLTMAVRVPSLSPLGLVSPVRLNPSSWLNDPMGLRYPLEIKDGSVTVEDSAYISNVVPGGGPLAPGQTFEVHGSGFTPLSRLQVDGVELAWSRVVSPRLIVASPVVATDLSGRAVRVRIGKERLTYFSYLRAATDFYSRVPLLRRTVPMFPSRLSRNWSLPEVVGDSKSPNKFTCVAVQNPNGGTAVLSIEIADSIGAVIGRRILLLPARHKFMAEVYELFPLLAPQPGRSLRLSSLLPVQAMAANGDSSAGQVVPVAFAAAP